MSITIANNALNNCTKLSDVVELINDESANDATAEMIAAAYAIDAAEEAGYGCGENELSAHLNFIEKTGAKFDFAEALELASIQLLKK